MRRHSIDDKEALVRYYKRCIYDIALKAAHGNKRTAKGLYGLICDDFKDLVKITGGSMYRARTIMSSYYVQVPRIALSSQ